MASAIKEEVDCQSTVMTALFILAALQLRVNDSFQYKEALQNAL